MRTIIFTIMAAGIMLSCNLRASNNSKNNSLQTDQYITNMKPIQLTKADFIKKVADIESSANQWKYLGDKPAIVDFYADWCGPCKMVAPILDELATEYGEQIYIYKVDTDKERDLAAAFGIRSIPSLLFIPVGGEPQMARGAMSKDGFKEIIDSVLLNKEPEDK